jgi:hypothetical protein
MNTLEKISAAYYWIGAQDKRARLKKWGVRQRYISQFAFLLAVSCLASGCVNRMSANWDPSDELTNTTSFYVKKLGPDQRGINKLISDKLADMGYKATTGLDVNTPSSVDIVVDYADKWMWDITMYMVELTITFRSPKTDAPLGSGNSYHTSLTRKTPKEMVEEVLTNIFNKAKGIKPTNN